MVEQVSHAGHDILTSRLSDMARDVKAKAQNIGEAGDSSDWHDNAILDEAHRSHEVSLAQMQRLHQRLKSVEFIEPNRQTAVVEIGNDVSVLHDTDDEQVTYTMLGPLDVIARIPGAISYESPLGKALLGHPKDAEVEYSVNKESRIYHHKVIIIDIQPGNF
jgi:transcription elongation factor GreA